MTDLSKQAVSGTKWSGISTAFTQLLQLAQILILARLLSPEDFGLLAMVMVLIGFALAYADLGFSNALIHFQDLEQRQLSSLYWAGWIAGWVLFTLMYLGAPLAALFYKEPSLVPLMHYSAFIFLIFPLGQQFQVLFQKELEFKLLAIIEILAASAGLATGVVMALLHPGPEALIGSFLSQAGLRSLLFAGAGWKRWPPGFHFSFVDLKPVLRFGAFQMAEKAVNYFCANLDKLIIGLTLGSSALGLYNVAYQLMQKPVGVFNPIINRVSLPVFSKIQDDNARLRSGYLKVIGLIALILFPVYTGMSVLAEPFVLALLGSDWSLAVPILQIMALLGFFMAIGNPMGSLLIAKGRPDIGFYLNCFRLVVYAVTLWVASAWGLPGMVTGLLLVNTFLLTPVAFKILKHLIDLPTINLWAAMSPAIFTSIFMGGFLLALDHFILPAWPPLVTLIVSTLAGAVVYYLVLYQWKREMITSLQQLIFARNQT